MEAKPKARSLKVASAQTDGKYGLRLKPQGVGLLWFLHSSSREGAIRRKSTPVKAAEELQQSEGLPLHQGAVQGTDGRDRRWRLLRRSSKSARISA